MSSKLLGHLKHKGEARGPLKCPGFSKGTPMTARSSDAQSIWSDAMGSLHHPNPTLASRSPRSSPAHWWAPQGHRQHEVHSPWPWRCSQVSEPHGVFKCWLWSLKRARRWAGRFVFAKQSMKGEWAKGAGRRCTKAGGGLGLGKYSSVGLNWYAQPLKPRAGRSQGMKAQQRALGCIDPIPSEHAREWGEGARTRGGHSGVFRDRPRLGTFLRNEGISSLSKGAPSGACPRTQRARLGICPLFLWGMSPLRGSSGNKDVLSSSSH